MSLSQAQASTILTRLGWRVNTVSRYTRAIINFQRGWNLGPMLVADGVKGPKTNAALLLSEARRRKGLGTASAHFSFMEVRCKCERFGIYSDCQRIWTARRVFAALEGSRQKVNHSIHITSGCRCPSYNSRIDGAPRSKHRDGIAIDWTGPDKDTTRSWHIWRGIGYGAHSDHSLHTDLRPTSSTSFPMMWPYPGW